MENLSLKMNYFKKKLKLTNEQISALSGIPVQTVATISSGRTKNPSLRTLKSLAKVFNCTLDDLINLTDAKTPVLLDEQTVKLIEKLKNSDSIKRLFELVSVMDNTDVQAVVGLAERLFVTSGDKNNVK
ncbi:MAG: helix-turn-helix transcriptional regulator [Candidatus Gastranaerophilales bacterium]|nr:helix-turn-helix transcriptional regulator [Candidatus Gastranaerophilales bacterium]